MSGIDLQRLLRQYAFESVLWIGASPPPALPDNTIKMEYRHTEDVKNPDTLQGRWDLVIIDGDMMNLPREPVIQIISCLRDLHARRLVVLYPDTPANETGIRHEDLISLGLKAMHGQPGVYYHDLYDYKDTPDWLNNKFWANPENWNKFRW